MLVVPDQPELGSPLGHWYLRGPAMREMTVGREAQWLCGLPGDQL